MSLSQLPELPHRTVPRRSHVVQFYSDDAALIEELGRVVIRVLNRSQSAIVIATHEHHLKLRKKLEAEVPGFMSAVSDGRYIALDARETLNQFMSDGTPDPTRFSELITRLVKRASQASRGKGRVFAFGEMVALLCAEGNSAAAYKLEELWDRLMASLPIVLYCAYPLQTFRNLDDPELFLRVCTQHSGIVGGEIREFPGLEEAILHAPSVAEWQKREEKFRLFLESVQDYAIYMLDPQGNVSTWNKGASRIKGYKAGEIIGKNFALFYPEEDVRSGKPQMELEIAAREGRFEDEGWRIRKDGSKFWANVIITAVRDESNQLIGYGKVTRDITEKWEAQRALDRANQELRKQIVDRQWAERRVAESEKSLRLLSLHLLRTQDEERKRIGRDLHDSLGQVLTAMKMSLQALSSKDSNHHGQIERCVRLADDCIREVRTISYLLYPPMLDELGLKSAIPWYLDGFAIRSGIQTRFEVSQDFDRLPRDTELALFRVLQEALTNVHRHSGSQIAHISLVVKGDYAHLEIRDQGKGIAAEVLESTEHTLPTGVGLRGMDERMRQLGGRLEISSSPEGTTITAIVPLQQHVVNGRKQVPA